MHRRCSSSLITSTLSLPSSPRSSNTPHTQIASNSQSQAIKFTERELTRTIKNQGRNIILSRTYEYRLPSTVPPAGPSSHTQATEAPGEAEVKAKGDTAEKERAKVVLDMTSRFLGLVVVPGEFITKIEVEEFASQVKAGGSKYADLAVGVM